MDRERDANRLAAAALAANDPTGWFERLYAAADSGDAIVPWDGGTANRLLIEWAGRDGVRGAGRRAVVVGCGYGDDAAFVAGLGFDTDAFDIAASAIGEAKRRFPGTGVRYRVADLLDLPAEWRQTFDLVVEIYTLQALPAPLRRDAAAGIAGLVRPGGTLVLIAARQDDRESLPAPPWPLRRAEIEAMATYGLSPVLIEELADAGRWRAEFRRPPTTTGPATADVAA